MSINIAGLNKAEILAALYNAARPQGLGFLQYDPKPMLIQEAETLLKQDQYFDYVKGRVLKVSLTSDTELEERLYDRDNGPGVANQVITSLRFGKGVDNPLIQATHEAGVATAAQDAQCGMEKRTTVYQSDGAVEYHLGLGDAKEILAPAVEKAQQKRSE